MGKWEIEVVETRVTEISQDEYEMRLEELLNALLRKEGAFSTEISTNGFAPLTREEIA